MRNADMTIVRPSRPHDCMWNAAMRRMMDPDHRLVLRWCAHLAFEDVMRIDHGSIRAAVNDPARDVGGWRMMFGNGRLPLTLVPAGLVRTTQRHVEERARVCSVTARHDEPVFDESHGERITRESLFEAIRRALALVRLSDAYLSSEVATR